MDQIRNTDESQYSYEGNELAVVGMAGRFPGARNLDEFWHNLKNGVESISFFNEKEVLETGVDPELVKTPHYVKAGGVIDDADLFDASFFGFYPQEAAILDPQQRIFLEIAWEALENAGYNPEAYPDWIGLFAGMGMNTYLLFNLLSNQDVVETVHPYQLTISSDKDFLPTRVSYKLNLRGPSVNVQTACSTSLVAVHLACQSLLNYQCDIAMAGGVAIRLPQKQGYLYQEGGIASPDGHCRAFDVNAAGTVGGNGAGIVVIKRLEEALTDGDHILAIIKGSAINNDGSMKVGYTAPSVEGQSEVIATAQAIANVEPGSISYIEAHGTGTVLGDPIEIAALNKVFQASTTKKEYCAIGSVKTNVGHLDAAAGITSLIKTILALINKQIPPSINFDAPNPRIDFKNSPFFVNAKLRDWEVDSGPRRAGVSAFGIGGTNAHVIIEEAPVLPRSDPSREWQLVQLSARSSASLETATDNLVSLLKENTSVSLSDVAYTLQVGRKAFDYRRFVVAQTLEEVIDALEEREPGKLYMDSLAQGGTQHSPPVVFMFTGQGAQYVNMAYDLYRSEPIFHDQVDLCAELLMDDLGLDIRQLIFPEGEFIEVNGSQAAQTAAETLKQTSITQPVLFVIEFALSVLLMEWGIHPKAMIGHSIGEYVAACLAGVFTLQDALTLVAARGRLMQSLPGGSMVSIPLGEISVRTYLNKVRDECPNISLASVNAPSLCAVSGPYDEIDAFTKVLANEEVEFRQLHTSHAFHSPMMEPILKDFTKLVSGIDMAEPELPFISNVSGTWITPEDATDPNYWASHLRNAVRFSDGIQELLSDPAWVFIEVGPGRTLTTLTKGVISSDPSYGSRSVTPTIRHPRSSESDIAFLLNSLGRLWLAGVGVDWNTYYAGESRQRIQLPAYPFERQRYWIEADQPFFQYTSHPKIDPAGELYKIPDIDEWFYSLSWKRTDLKVSSPDMEDARKWLIFGSEFEEGSLDWLIRDQLLKNNSDVLLVQMGDDYSSLGNNRFTINPQNSQDYDSLIAELKSNDWTPDNILHLWNLSDGSDHEMTDELVSGFYSLLYLTQAVSSHGITKSVQIVTLSESAQDVLGTEMLQPEQATTIGLCKVISQEYQNITCRSIDILPEDKTGVRRTRKMVDRLLREFTVDPLDRIVAYRGDHRWVQVFEPAEEYNFGISDELPVRLTQEGVYLITGGLGRIGLTLAEYLAQKVRARLILVDQYEFSGGREPSEWQTWLNANGDANPVGVKIRKLLSIKDAGGEVMIVRADAANIEEMRAAFQHGEDKYGRINGVIHAAGIVGEGAIKSITDMGRKDCEAQFQSKVTGTNVLAEVLGDYKINFCLLQSSLSAVLGGLGLSAYTAANLYMDTFAAQQNRSQETPWISVNWDGWLFDEERGSRTTLVELTMTPNEGVRAFEKIMSLEGDRQVIISTAELESRIERWIKKSPAIGIDISTDIEAAEGEKPRSKAVFQRPNLPNPYVAPQDDLEDSIAQTWQKVLGIEQIGIHDDFFELGGHSLLATQLVTRLRDAYQVQLPLRKLFETPTIAGLAILIRETLADDTSAITGSPEAKDESKHSIHPVAREGNLELSFGQQRLWFLDQIEPNSPLYNNFTAIWVEGKLDVNGLDFSLGRIIERHEVLRTTFREQNGLPVQVIHPQMDFPLKVIDLSGLHAEVADAEVMRLAIDEAKQPFNLTDGPLLRVSLIGLSDEEHVIFLTMHHIISDGWSVRVLISEVAELYTAYTTMLAEDVESFSLPELPIQYLDFGYWQREWLQGEVLENQINYWKNQLADKGDGVGNVELFPDRPRHAIQTSNGASLWFELSPGLSQELEKLSQRAGVTLFMTLLAAFQALLYRYTGKEDINVGTPIANRTLVETESLIGFILNTLVMRTDLTGDPTFEETLQRVREVALGAYAHQDVPFEMLVEMLQPERDMSRAPFFQVIFDLQEAPLPTLELPGLVFSPLKVDSGTAKFDLALSMEMGGNRDSDFVLNGFFNYNTDLFDDDSITRLIEHWETLLASIVSNPEKRLSELGLYSQAEKHQILFDWNDNFTVTGTSRTIIEQFEVRASEYSDAVALTLVVDRDNFEDNLTYQDLDERANQLARFLQTLGVGPDVLVGVSLERSLEMIVALLGVHKAGGAFLPLDPAYPRDRLIYMIDDANVDVLLVQENLLHELPSEHSNGEALHRICLDRDWSLISNQSATKPSVKLSAENLAYVIYTSGSTGLPKGVMIPHGEFANHCAAMREHFDINRGDRVLQFASLNFDAALEQVFTALAAGASLFLRGNEIWPAEEFHKIVNERVLTVVNVPPAYWHQWAQFAADLNQLDSLSTQGKELSLRLVIIGGDVMQPESLHLWLQTPMNSVRLLNAYGPTETTITAATYEANTSLEAARENKYFRVPIGRPMANRTAYILDPQLNPVPINVPGELYFGGLGISRGYLNRYILTAYQFLPDPFVNELPGWEKVSEKGARMYRTGDRVRYRADGNIEFLGRIDSQVKIRGFRIELGEIEAVIGLHPAVSETAVAVFDGGSPAVDGTISEVEKRLVGYVVLLPGEALSISELHDYLKDNLPVYMIPANIILLDMLPLTPSGKVDRKALPEPDSLRPDVESVYVAPRDPVEEELAMLWSEVLGVEWEGDQSPIGVHDNFFELGGHSLLATQIISRLRETYQVDIPVRRVFETPTIAGLAETITESLVEHEDVENMDEILAELETLSDDDVRTLLNGEAYTSEE